MTGDQAPRDPFLLSLGSDNSLFYFIYLFFWRGQGGVDLVSVRIFFPKNKGDFFFHSENGA